MNTTTYDKEKHNPIAIEWLSKGFGKATVAAKIGINRATVFRWINDHPEFKEAVEEGLIQGAAFYEEYFHKRMMDDLPGNANFGLYQAKRIHKDWFADEDKKEDNNQKVEITVDVAKELIAKHKG